MILWAPPRRYSRRGLGDAAQFDLSHAVKVIQDGASGATIYNENGQLWQWFPASENQEPIKLFALSDWYKAWTSTGVNENGPILAFVKSVGQNFDPGAPPQNDQGRQLAASSGKIVPWGGGYNPATGIAFLNFYNPRTVDMSISYADKLQVDSFDVNQFGGATYAYNYMAGMTPGDDVMAAALNKWVIPLIPANAAPPVVWTATGGPSYVMNASNAPQPSAPAQPSAPSQSSATGGSSGASGSSGNSGSSASSGFDLSSLPWWAWALAGGVVLMFVMKD